MYCIRHDALNPFADGKLLPVVKRFPPLLMIAIGQIYPVSKVDYRLSIIKFAEAARANRSIQTIAPSGTIGTPIG